MCLTYTPRPHQKQAAFAVARVVIGKSLHEHFCLGKAFVPGTTLFRPFRIVMIGVEIVEVMASITFRNACTRQRPIRLLALRAIARHGPNHLWLALRECPRPIRRQRLRSRRSSLDD